MYHLLFQGIRQGLNFPGLGPHHQGAVTVSASPTVASSATTVPVATPVVDTYLSQGIGPISHGVSNICPKNESHFHLFFAYRQPYPRANKGLLPTEEVALQHSKNGAFSRSELFMETHNTTRFFADTCAYPSRVYQYYYNARSQLIFAQIIQSDIKTTTSKLLSNYLHFLFICDLYKILQLWSSKNIA